jgi:hypothetical protein
LGYRERKQALSNLIQTYLATFADIGVETWLMHGTLLGWWWNRKILPWDSDSDVQVTEASMHYLASYYNMTVFHYKTPRIPEGRDYMLEVNPHYTNREQSDKLNVIDARWVDTTSGLFIDITTARYNYTHPAGEGMLVCKDGHEYRVSVLRGGGTRLTGTGYLHLPTERHILRRHTRQDPIRIQGGSGSRIQEEGIDFDRVRGVSKDSKPCSARTNNIQPSIR